MTIPKARWRLIVTYFIKYLWGGGGGEFSRTEIGVQELDAAIFLSGRGETDYL